jgi:hypothetical protein
MRSSLCAVVISTWLRGRLAAGTAEDDAAAAVLNGPLSDPRSEAACRGSGQIIVHLREQDNSHSRLHEAGRHRTLASGYTSCMLYRYRLRCISSTNVSPEYVVGYVQTHFLPSTSYCTTALALTMGVYVHGECLTTSLSCPLAFPCSVCSAHCAHVVSAMRPVAYVSATRRCRRFWMV